MPNLGTVNRAFALSLAGDVLDAQDRPAEAFAAYAQSKAVLREAYAPNMEGLESVTARELRLAEYFRRRRSGRVARRGTRKPRAPMSFWSAFPAPAPPCWNRCWPAIPM